MHFKRKKNDNKEKRKEIGVRKVEQAKRVQEEQLEPSTYYRQFKCITMLSA